MTGVATFPASILSPFQYLKSLCLLARKRLFFERPTTLTVLLVANFINYLSADGPLVLTNVLASVTFFGTTDDGKVRKAKSG